MNEVAVNREEFWVWFRRIGWRYASAIASLLMFGILAARKLAGNRPDYGEGLYSG